MADTIAGGLGHDFLVGNGGADIFFAGTGLDEILGGDGVDVLYMPGDAQDYFISYTDELGTTLASLNGITYVRTDVEYVAFGDITVAYANLASTLKSGNIAVGWVQGDHYLFGAYQNNEWVNGWHYGWQQNIWTVGWNVGWNYGWHTYTGAWYLGWGVGWHVGWYFASWALGWGIGWYFDDLDRFGWHLKSGWHYGQYMEVDAA